MDYKILVIIGLIGAAVIINIIAGKKNARQMAQLFILEAERLYGGEVGKAKFRDAVSQVYNLLPSILKALYPQDELIKWCESVVQEAFNKLKSDEAIGEMRDKEFREIECIEPYIDENDIEDYYTGEDPEPIKELE